MEMTAVWKEKKRKRSFPLYTHRLRKLANNRELPTFPQLRRRLGFLYLQARLTSTLTKSVTYMPGTFCYRHARSHHKTSVFPLGSMVDFGGTRFRTAGIHQLRRSDHYPRWPGDLVGHRGSIPGG